MVLTIVEMVQMKLDVIDGMELVLYYQDNLVQGIILRAESTICFESVLLKSLSVMEIMTVLEV